MITADIIYIAACLVLAAGHYAIWRGGVLGKVRILNVIALLPVFATLLSLVNVGWEPRLIPAYLGTVLYCLAFTADSAKRFLPAAVASCIGIAAGAVLCVSVGGYRKPMFLDDFNKLFGTMKKYYVLADHKQTDWDAVYSEYEPQIAALGRDDKDEYFDICYKFCEEFDDLHVFAMDIESMHPDMDIKGIQSDICGGDPGFTAVRLDDGRVLACNVSPDSDVYAVGLRVGSELVSFNGTEINEYIDSVDPVYMTFADIDNLEFCRPLMAFGVYGDSAELGFKGGDGSTVNVKITPSGRYSDRIRTAMETLFGKSSEKMNYVWEDMGGDIACIEINDFADFPGLKKLDRWDELRELWENEDDDIYYPPIYLLMEDDIKEIKAAGKTKLILDLRHNGGGMIDQASQVVDFFSSEPLFLAEEEYTNPATGKTVRTEPMKTKGNYGSWDGDIVILVSPETVSAAEIFVNTMKRLPNVTVMGLADTGGSAMGVSGTRTSLLRYQFSMYKMIDEDGEILIDGGTDMQSRLKRDVEIKLGEEAFRAIFTDKRDYAMDEALRYLGAK